MFKDNEVFSSFSVKDLKQTKEFYSKTLGLDVEEDTKMGLILHVNGGAPIFIYQKDNHEPASFTVLNFVVDDIDKAVVALADKGIKMERYKNLGFEQDEKGIARGRQANMGPDIAWFTDPSGNVLSVMQQ